MGVGAAVTVGMGIVGGHKQKKAGKASDKLANKNADSIRAESLEEAAKLEKAQGQSLGFARAAQGGSGVRSGGGTTDDYLKEMESVFADDLKNLKKSAKSREAIAREGGEVAKDQASANAWGTLASATSSAIGIWKT